MESKFYSFVSSKYCLLFYIAAMGISYRLLFAMLVIIDLMLLHNCVLWMLCEQVGWGS